MYEKIKKQNGEEFAQTLRNFHNGLLEIPDLDVLLRHAGREAEPLLPYLMTLLASNDMNQAPRSAPEDPFVLLERAGYDAFYADTLKKQNSIKHYFEPGELLCTFNDNARHERYHIVHAVKKDVEKIERGNFRGREQREDEYGTSVISIQMLKRGGFISIKNRYNHAVNNCDNTFGSNPDNIIQGLSAALKDQFNVDFSATRSSLPEGYTWIGNQILKYHTESNNTYYGDQVWAEDGVLHEINKSAGDALFDIFLFDNKTKSLKNIIIQSKNSFADDFNRCYGGDKALCVQNGNLTLNGEILIGAERSQIKTLFLPGLTTTSENSLFSPRTLRKFEAPDLIEMGSGCLYNAFALAQFVVPALTKMGWSCLHNAHALKQLTAPALTKMAPYCLENAYSLTQFKAPALTKMGNECFYRACGLRQFEVPSYADANDHNLQLIKTRVRQNTSVFHSLSSKIRHFFI